MLKRLALPALAVAVFAVAHTGLHGQTGAVKGEWPHYGSDQGNTHYSPLTQVDASNFSRLEVAWRFKTDSLGPRPEFQFESTPLMVGGMVFSTGGSRRAVVALDAGTGELKWMHSEDEGARGSAGPRQLSGRGLAFWTDGRESRILYVTPGYRLIALDAKTGNVIPAFGDNGSVDLKKDDDQLIDPMSIEIGLHATPAVARNVVIIGAAHRSGGVPTGKTNVKGYVRGFDVRTGKRLWIFHTIPSPGEFGNDTWLNDSWSYTGNAGVWSQISVDEQLGLAYLPVELPTGDYFGANRPGNNLFGESIVAVDLQTGKRKWHYQLVHHGLWDMDIPCPPILTDLVINGRPVKALAQPTKQAFLYVFNRETGQPIWPIEERPVAKGDVPGEWYAPTQPFPLDATGKPFNYDTQGFVENDLIDFTPALREEAKQIATKYKLGPIFTPPVVSKIEGPLATLVIGSGGGGTNWPGGSFDPETKIVYVSSNKSLSQLGLVPPRDPSKNDLAFVQGNAAQGARTRAGAGSAPAAPAAEGGGEGGGGGGLTVQGLPIMKPPYGLIAAIDLNKGQMIWQVAHGETPANITNHPLLKGLTIPRTGRPGTVGQLVTKTLLVVGEAGFGPTPNNQRGAMLRAYDKASGKEVGAVYMPAPQGGAPMTYMWRDRQYTSLWPSGEPATAASCWRSGWEPDVRQISAVAVTVLALAAVVVLAQGEARKASAAWSPLDSPRVHVWADRGSEPASGTLPSIRITLDGKVEYRAAGAPAGAKTPSPGGYAVVIELKDAKVAPLANTTKYPLAFPRPNVKKVLENERVLIWDYTWTAGAPTPMHYHDKDVVVAYLEDGALRSTDPNGQAVINEHYFGFTKLNARDRVHTEELIKGKGRAIIVEMK